MTDEPIFATKSCYKKYNRDNASLCLDNLGVKYTVHNKGAHIIIYLVNDIIDFWPGSIKYKFRKNKQLFGEYDWDCVVKDIRENEND